MKPRIVKISRCVECLWCMQHSRTITGDCSNKDSRRPDTNLQDINDIPDWCPLDLWVMGTYLEKDLIKYIEKNYERRKTTNIPD